VSEQLGEIEMAVVKQATSRFAADCLAPAASQELICVTAMRAIERLTESDIPDPFVLDTPVRVTVEFFTSDMADRATRIPFTERDGTRVSLIVQDMAAAYSGFRAMVMLALG
jgi:D-aminopeptidase